jgi:hypothetical protein
VSRRRIKLNTSRIQIKIVTATSACLPPLPSRSVIRFLTCTDMCWFPWLLAFFFNWYSGGWSPIGALGTAATNRPIVPAPGHYDDGEIGGMIGRRNRSTRRKPAPVLLCPPQTPHAVTLRYKIILSLSHQYKISSDARQLQRDDCSLVRTLLATKETDKIIAAFSLLVSIT